MFASAANYNRSDPDGPVWLRDVECTGSADSLFGCYDYNPDTQSCKASQDIGVVCSTRGKEHVLAKILASNYEISSIHVLHEKI